MRAILLQGLAFGDESKGATVDALCRKFPVDQIVRFNGGPQTEHNVVTPEGAHHTFSMFGSGMLANPDLKTHLSKYVLIDPTSIYNESSALAKLTPDPRGRLSIDPEAIVITPFHVRLNRLREIARGDRRHGSCGRGVGTAREYHLKYGNEYTLLAGDLLDWKYTHQKLQHIWFRLLEELIELRNITNTEPESIDTSRLTDFYCYFAKQVQIRNFEPSEYMLFEGAQGVMLDEKHGFQPHTTWTNCTFENADSMLDAVGCSDRTRIGCFRSYYTRHGAGPFPTEDPSLLNKLPELHNKTGKFQGSWRVGSFDFELAKKAIEIVGGVDYISLSHLDIYGEGDLDLAGLGYPVGIWAYGPTYKQRDFHCELVDRLSHTVLC